MAKRTSGSMIDALGGTMAVSRALGLNKGIVSGWRTRGIPPRRWAALVRLADKKGKNEITFEALVATGPDEART
jgi:hypothetical protein